VEVGLARGDLTDPRLHDDAEDGVLYVVVFYAGAVYGLPYRYPAEFRRTKRRQRPTELPERRPRRPQNYRSFHSKPPIPEEVSRL
jgi:hypothetical protein